MKGKTRQKVPGDRPVGSLKEIDDFLPPPEQLAPVDELVKITISLDRESLEFFKETASKLGSKYQRMMRGVLRGYARRYTDKKR
ncbi:MAG: BrnA antitoxin family protein [Deltaproteobacteria bacterium]|nr:BrnA antitoxin family protein [Deltaproteobacteria bacterium]